MTKQELERLKLAAQKANSDYACAVKEYKVGCRQRDYGWSVIHLKTGNEYTVIGEAINCTDEQDGQQMVIYRNKDKVFVREVNEFQDRFKPTDWQVG